jgi:hypothetical protein
MKSELADLENTLSELKSKLGGWKWIDYVRKNIQIQHMNG